MMAPRRSGIRELDDAVEVLAGRKDEWAALPVDRRIALLRLCLASSERCAADVVAGGCKAKGIDPRASTSGEEWMSGPIGVIRQLRLLHNTLMFERPLKTVLWGPFTAWPKPVWFTTHGRAHLVGRRMASFEASPSLWRLPAIAADALRPG